MTTCPSETRRAVVEALARLAAATLRTDGATAARALAEAAELSGRTRKEVVGALTCEMGREGGIERAADRLCGVAVPA